MYFWKCNFPINHNVCLSVCRSVGLSQKNCPHFLNVAFFYFLKTLPLPSLQCSQNVHNMFHDMFTTCSRPVHNMFHDMFSVHDMFTACSRPFHNMITTCSQHVHSMFTTCSQHVYDMFTTCSRHVHDMFTACS